MEPTPELTLAATNAKLRKEARMLEEMIPHYVPYEGPLPKTIEAFNALPEPWRAAMVHENPGFIQDLGVRERIRQELAERKETIRRGDELLKGSPVASRKEFDALPLRDRQELLMQVTSEQRRYLATGEVPPDTQGYF